ncbi:hypothetical protein RRG08_006543 [Elysia crispata]|uniref:PiggyBac transposable element-derived protein domain-containing protein n=1 Tax=Elysia crispata TaxID=231223 RepID=A0AAE1AUM2_9GAST|nr:hypothetical protein RRG08_006543 [Elysia crispata]
MPENTAIKSSEDNTLQPDEEHPDYKLYKVKTVVDKLKVRFKANYKPKQGVLIDENIVAYRGKTSHLKGCFGIKVSCIGDASSLALYTCYLEIFQGAHAVDQGHGRQQE